MRCWSAGEMAADSHQSDVVFLLAHPKLSYLLEHSFQQELYREMALSPQRFNEPSFAEVGTVGMCRVCNAVRVEQQGVARRELHLGIGTFPAAEHPQNSRVRVQALESTVPPK